MKKALIKTLSTFVISTLFTCIVCLIFLDIITAIINEDNISKSIQEININDVLVANTEQYEEILSQYTEGTSLLNKGSTNTSFSKEELNSIINSSEYADILGSYIIDENLLDGIDDIDTKDYEEMLESISTEDLEKLLKESGIDYNQADIDFITNTVPAVAPTVMEEVGTLNVNNSAFNISGLFQNISEKTNKVAWFFLIACVAGIVALHFKNYYFTVIFAIVTGSTCIGLKICDVLVTKGLEKIPSEYKNVVDIYAMPLNKKMDYYFVLFLVAAVLFIVAYIICNAVFTKDSIGSSINFLHLIRGFDDEDNEKEDNTDIKGLDDYSDDFANLDLARIEVRDINKEIDEGWF